MLNCVVDMSANNPIQNLVKSDHLLGIIQRATLGMFYNDPKYQARKGLADHAGLLWGAYHFGRSGSGRDQANKFLDVVKPDSKTLLALDLEIYGTFSMNIESAEEFVEEIQEKLGYYPVLYTSDWVLNDVHLPKDYDGILSQCPLWLANYTLQPIQPLQLKPWKLWQYTDGKHGVGNPPWYFDDIYGCDRSIANFETEQGLVSWWQNLPIDKSQNSAIIEKF
jgi:lysozyme